ncbi:hypothetical protein BACCAP_04134 [Pseudoflavonifractor capillosus ATCC 29799]|uniref:Uncharacterized protein n=1 Tax=Pseudoflavonifractor capillosus ATCC 29799 TaxID=411467 RepID=A6P0W8_9FIRM|nr:hypothetical protein BACCAP_04134 [Pseudoflavonifractor capillosus ATCC 29799]
MYRTERQQIQIILHFSGMLCYYNFRAFAYENLPFEWRSCAKR